MTRDLLAALLADVAARRPAVVATDLAGGPGRLVHPFDPDPGTPPWLLAAARAAAAADRSEPVDGPQGRVFLRVHNPSVRVVVVGAVHVTQALAPMVAAAGYDLTVLDPRSAFATAERFPGTRVLVGWPDEHLPGLGLDRRTAVVVLTHDPKIDDPALALALRSDCFHVGALGSRRTHAARRERLRAEGFSDADLDRIHGPVGLPLGGRSPGEIAVAILAEVVARLRGGGVGPRG